MILSCEKISKKYGKKTVVDQLTFQVEPGEVFALLGVNGAGKTTTIKMVLGLTEATEGRAYLAENTKTGYSPESPYFPSFLTGREVLEYYANMMGMRKKDHKDIACRLLDDVGLENDRTKVKHYSKGMMQRLSLAQALIGNPNLLILDEPTSGLDALGRIEMIDLIGKFKNKGVAVVLNSHILTDIERVCSRGIILKKGRQVALWDQQTLAQDKTLEQYFLESIQEEEGL